MSQVVAAEVRKKTGRGKRRLLLMAGLLIFIASFAIVAVPVLLIMPFKAQTPRGIHVSYLFRRWSPILTVLATGGIIVASIYLWRAARWWTKGFLVILTLISLAPVWASRQNHFEWMFKPIAQPEYSQAGEATSVADNDMVMAVEINGEAAAYPIRAMAYHHVVEDVVGGVPLAATY
jgi:hypothetical protein